MKKISFLFCLIIITILSACHKAPSDQPAESTDSLEQSVIKDFTNDIALTQYSNLTNVAVSLNASIAALNSNPTDANLLAAQTSWKNIRSVWEQCEGFLFGPVEDNNYDPNTDTWPTDYTQMDSLLASSNPLELPDIQDLPQSLRGYHPLEYIIFGVNGTRTAGELTAREKKYITGLSADILYNNVQPLYESWTSAPINYAQEILTAGNGSEKFSTRQGLFLAITGSMSDICNEVGSEKMKDPYDARDPSITESPYSGNTLSDFKSNIIGLQNVYLGLNGSKGIKDLVAAKNKSLDNSIQAQITAAINSFDNITESYEKAILDQRVQVQQTMQQLSVLKDMIDNDLKNFIIQNVQD